MQVYQRNDELKRTSKEKVALALISPLEVHLAVK